MKGKGKNTLKDSENIFSNDEEETKFVRDVGRAKEEAWTSSKMQWNTIHGIPWKRCEALGQGGFGSVSVGMREDKKLFAVKSVKIEYPTTGKVTDRIKCQITEIKMMKFMRYRYIVRSLGCGRSKGDNGLDGQETLDVFLEYAPRGSLRHVAKARQKPFEEEPYVRQYTYDVLKALQYMKTIKVVHGDIKMANLLLSDDCVKLADWGGAKQVTRANLATFLIGTKGFKSPEVQIKHNQSYPSDIFSLGCTVIEMITGQRPSQVLKTVRLRDKLFGIMTDKTFYGPEIPNIVSPQCKDFLEHCLDYTEQLRWTAAELLHHPFVTCRDKTSTLPYGMPLPTQIGTSLLQPPRLNHTELPDDPITSRVQKYLSTSFMANLMPSSSSHHPISTTEIILISNSTKPSAPAPAPLPPFTPELDLSMDSKLLDGLLDYLFQSALGDSESPKAAKSRSSKQKKEKVQVAPVDQIQFNSSVALEEFVKSVAQGVNAMEALNEVIRAESLKSIPSLRDITLADILPPSTDGFYTALPATDARGETAIVPDGPLVRVIQSSIEQEQGAPRDLKRGRPLWMGCTGRLAVDAAEPAGRRPQSKGKKKKK